jgi:hypothetical protein
MAGLFDDIISRQIGIERTKAGEVKRLRKILKELDNNIEMKFRNLPENYTQAQLNKLLKEIRLITIDFYNDKVIKYHKEIINGAVSSEVDFAHNIVSKYLAVGIVAKPDKKTIIDEVISTKYQGEYLIDWTEKLGRDKASRIAKDVRNAAINNSSNVVLFETARNSIRISNNNADTVTKAYVNNSVNISRDNVYSSNPESVEVIVWSSILDSRTTITCAVRSNKKYNALTKEPIGHDNQWNGGPGAIHWGCRSVGIPTNKEGVIVEGSGAGEKYNEGTKTAIGAESGYERGGNKKENGKVAKIPTNSNQLDKQIVPADMDYDTWLRKQPRAFIEDTLGKGKASLFIDKKVSLQEFVVEDGTELTFEQLNKKVA